MARYTGPVTKIARTFGEPIFGHDKAFDKKKYPPGQHGTSRKKKQKSDYAVQLKEKQKAKHTYGVLERQFRKTFDLATRKHGVTGTVLLQLLESRLDNTVYRLGIAPTRRAARQLVSHKHIAVDGKIVNIPSALLKPGAIVAVRSRSDIRKSPWLEWNPERLEGKFLIHPEREMIPERINEQLIVELYSK